MPSSLRTAKFFLVLPFILWAFAVDAQQTYPPEWETILSPEEALEQSKGQFLIHYGEGFSPTTLGALVRYMESAGLAVEVAAGGPPRAVTSYIFGNHYPPTNYDARNSAELAALLVEIAEENGLVRQSE